MPQRHRRRAARAQSEIVAPLTVADLERCCTAAARRLWPDYGEPVHLVPPTNLDWGDLTSDFCLRLAKRQAVSPESLGRRLIEQLELTLDLEFRLERGFLNVRFPDPFMLASETPRPPRSAEPALIFLTVDAAGKCRWPAARLAALAVLQSLFFEDLGQAARLCCGGQTLAGGTPAARWHWLMGRCGCAEDLSACLERERPGRTYVWLAPRLLPEREFAVFARRAEAADPPVKICSYSTVWLTAEDNEQGPGELLADFDDCPAAWLLYLASAVPTADLDAVTPRSAERANLLWYAAASCRRLHELVQPSAASGAAAGQPQTTLSAPERALCIRLALMEALHAQAAHGAAVPALVARCDETLNLANAIMNNPATRGRIQQGTLAEHERKIMSGIRACLSSMMKWRIFSAGAI
jgi:hypothetical protein